MKFLDVKTDYAFKRVFGAQESAPIFISFLNAVLEYEGEHRIVSLEIIDPYQAPKLAPTTKSRILSTSYRKI